MRAVLLVLAGSVGVQLSAALSIGLFEPLGVIPTSGLRLLIAAVILCAIFRPRLRGRSRAEWVGIGLYGVAMATMNIFLYLAIDRIPLGIATTIDFLGPCLVALAGSRRLRDGLLALAAFAGVALIAGLGGPLDPVGLLFAVAAGASFGGYTLLAPRIGKSDGGLGGLALSVAFAAVLTLPVSLPALPNVGLQHWGVLAVSALLGMALAFTVDTLAGKLTSARVIGVLFAFDPVVGTLVGAIWLDQAITVPALLGMALVISAGAGIVWFAGARAAYAEPVTEHGAAESVEVERKYEVGAEIGLPRAEELAAAGFVAGEPETFELVARYFDTPDRRLAAARLAVRSRQGGHDAGWHLKERGDGSVRELHWPEAQEPPAGLLAELRERLGVEPAELETLASLRTMRTIVRLADGDRECVELADDRVLAEDRSGVRRAWREWEAELLPGADPAALDAVEPVLLAAGAVPSLSEAKVARASGRLVDLAASRGADAGTLDRLRALDLSDREAARRLDA